ncbi:MAG: FeoB small GTPase domain-containing protein [Bellilinea sp.]
MTHCAPESTTLTPNGSNIALVGNPNVGKSALFHRLTGKYVVVANYPGTTVEITQGLLRGLDGVTLVDTPGIVAFPPRSEDEQVTARVVLGNDIETVLQVGDAKNLRRTLHLTVQLAELGRPLALALNMMDEAEARGMTLETQVIETALGIPVTATVATRGLGVNDLVQAVSRASHPKFHLTYPPAVETALAEIEPLLPESSVTRRGLGLLWLTSGALNEEWFMLHCKAETLAQLRIIREKAALSLAELVEAQTSSHKIRTLDFGGGREGVPFSTPVEAPLAELVEARQPQALRQAQGADGPVAEPVEAQNSSHKIRPLDFGGGREGVPFSTPFEAPLAELVEASVAVPVDTRQDQALRQAQGAVEALAAIIQQTREAFVTQVAGAALHEAQGGKPGLGVTLGRLATHPVWGLPILLLALYGMYWFVGVFGASTLVGLLEKDLFGNIINPWLSSQIANLIPVLLVVDFLVGEYGIWTVGVTYAVALLLPIVITFFITFGILEDSGYLPRLAVLTNRMFTWMGLNGQAVLPMVLGLGCVTMATMTTRVLSRPRDRILVTLLLALAVPCSAQLGVVMGMLAGVSLGASLIWGGVVLLVLILIGWLAARLMPGERTQLVVELPPLRFPVLSNVLVKTAARLEWYIKEAVPLFLLGTAVLFALDKLGVLPWIINGLEPVVTGWLGLPAEAAAAFLLGFLRRDFAATNLYLMQRSGQLNELQVVVAITTITLFVPCIASMFILIKERGTKMGLAMIAFIFPFAILVGGLLFRLLSAFNWGIG